MRPIKENKNGGIQASALGRRELMKLGAGAVIATLGVGAAKAQESVQGNAKDGSDFRSDHLTVTTGTGWKNDANRAFGNGPMDDTSRQLVSYVSSFSESNLTLPVLAALGDAMVDQMACLVAGFESEPARISARIARMNQSSMKCTVMGYGLTTTAEDATFANCCMVRHADFCSGEMIPGILAIGEALHSTGSQVLVAVTLAHEIQSALGRAGGGFQSLSWDGPYESLATALAVGKLMGLNEDKLANALSLAIVPHLPMSVTHVGVLSMWKGVHGPSSVRSGVYAALLAREGMTGPAQPFEARNGWFDHNGPFKELRLPARTDGKMAVESIEFKRFPADADNQEILDQVVPQVRAWTKIDDIKSIEIVTDFRIWQEVGDPEKWDPRNRETADHSIPYVISAALIDGDVYLPTFTPKRYLEDTAIRNLMQKITMRANTDFGEPRYLRGYCTEKSGEQMVKDLYELRLMSHDDIVAKFNRATAAYHGRLERNSGTVHLQIGRILRKFMTLASPYATSRNSANRCLYDVTSA